MKTFEDEVLGPITTEEILLLMLSSDEEVVSLERKIKARNRKNSEKI